MPFREYQDGPGSDCGRSGWEEGGDCQGGGRGDFGVTGLAPEDVWVVFEEVAARDWYVGETDVETRRARPKAAG